MNTLFFELIQVSLGNRETLSRVPTADEWQQLYDMAERQTILGICFVGVSRLHELSEINANDNANQQPITDNCEPITKNLPRKLFIRWAGRAAIIHERNELLDKRCIQLQQMLLGDGFRSCILKGQGVARLYKYVNANHGPSMVACSEVPPLNSPSSLTSNPNNPASSIDSVELKFQHPASNPASCILHSASNPASCILHSASNNDFDLSQYRQPGDIDIWLEGGFEKVMAYVNSTYPTREVNELEIHYHCFRDTEVEIHYHPFFMRNPIKNRRLQQFFESQAESCYQRNVTKNTESEITFTTPTMEFNLVHLLVHIYHHLMTEGVGLRQVMDYYFVLQTSSKVPSSKFQEVRKTIKELGLEKFASALLWVINEVFIGHSPNHSTLTPNPLTLTPNEPNGRFLLEEIMKSGNFGKHDERQKNLYKSKWYGFWTVHFKTFRFWRFDHWAWFWSPLWRIRSFVWKKCNGFV